MVMGGRHRRPRRRRHEAPSKGPNSRTPDPNVVRLLLVIVLDVIERLLRPWMA
jgi:hypothetical protein